MAADPGRLVALLRDLADGAVPYRAVLREAAETSGAHAVAASDRASRARSMADAAVGTAEDQRRAVAEVVERVAAEGARRSEVGDRARHAAEYARQTVEVVGGLRRRWEHELATAEALVAELRDRVEMGGRVGEDARRRLPAALERLRCCATAVARCREAAGLAAAAEQRARVAAGLAAEHDGVVAQAGSFADEARAAADEASSRSEQARHAGTAAEDAGARIRGLHEAAAQHSEAGADGLADVGERAVAAAEALAQFDQGGLR